jgi:hypothetical protein
MNHIEVVAAVIRKGGRIFLSITTNTGWQRKNKEKWGFLWFFPRLFVSLQHQR